MADAVYKKELSGILKRIKKEKDGFIYDNAYYIIPKLKGAIKSLSSGFNTGLCEKLEEKLSLLGYNADEYEICAALRKYGASDRDVRKTSAYLTYIYCKKLISGDDVSYQMRKADGLDYDKIVAECSPLEKRLLTYPDYASSDENTRSLYRAGLYRLSRKNGKDALTVLSEIPPHKLTWTLLTRKNHAAYHIILVFCFFTLLCSALLALTDDILTLILCSLPLYALSSFLSDRVLFRTLPPYAAARLGKNAELPACITVVTSLLDGKPEALFERIERMYFTECKNEKMLFGVLADLGDSKTKYKDEDDEIIGRAVKLTDQLNDLYGQRFYLFVRDRKYSMSERAFIAPDRKRGAVCELVRQLKTGESSLKIYGADAEKLTGIPYILTLDSDTLLYPDSSASLLRCAAHPANKAVLDLKKRVVSRGYGVFQPRIKPALKSEADTAFCRVFSADSGVDTYRGFDFDTLSAVYGRGSFCGKGLIDVNAFYICCVDFFPTERILSHDAIEGCRLRCCAVTDTVMYEGTPKNALSYFKRLDRWTRGDVQSLPFVKKYVKNDGGKKQINGLDIIDKYVLISNVLRAITPVFAVLSIIYGLIAGQLPAASVFALSYIILPSIFSVLTSHKGDLKSDFIIRIIMRLGFLFYEAQVVLCAVLCAFIRIFTHKHTLKWTTASAADRLKNGGRAYFSAFLPSLIAGIVLIITSGGGAALTGTLFALSPAVAYLSSSAPKAKKRRDTDRSLLVSAVADHMKYFDDLVNAEHNFLPPDNYQVLCGLGAAPRTSPTNIGLYLLSVVAAVDIGLYDARSLYERLLPTLKTLCKIPKKDGLLYNWYDTRTLGILSDFVSTVDCGNYLCCLISLRQAFTEYAEKDARLTELSDTVDALIKECDLSRLYDERSGLFYIGRGGGFDGKYDTYISEMKSTDIAAVGFGFAPVSHLSNLARPVIKHGGKYGIASWSGTAFEYFMPSLFLPSPPGSADAYALKFAAYMQKKDCVYRNGIRLYGRSESCYFAFDRDMNYQYKAHGVNALALCADTKEKVISPYSLFLMLKYDRCAERALNDIKRLGCYGKYGFYEALDLTRDRVGDGAAVIKCFMAHHIGMSVVSAVNALKDDVFVRRFCRDRRIASVLSLLCEKFPDVRAVSFKSKQKAEIYRYESRPFEPDCAALTNTVCTAVSDAYGTGLYYRNICICDGTAGGVRGFSLLCRNGAAFDLIKHVKTFSDDMVEYEYKDRAARLTVCKTEAAFRLDVKAAGGCMLCFEPVLSELTAHRRHTAYSSLFIVSETEGGMIRFIRRGKGAFCISICAYNNGIVPLSVFTRADEMHVYKTYGALFDSYPETSFGACIYPRLCAKTDEDNISFYIGAGKTKAEADKAVFGAVREDKNASGAVLPPVEQAVFCKVLRCITRPSPKTAGARSSLPYRQILYKHGISGDRPIILLDFTGDENMAQLRSVFPAYAQTVVRLLICGIAADTVVLYDDDDGYLNRKKRELYRIAGACGLSALIGVNLHFAYVEDEEKAAFSDVCVYKISKEEKVGSASFIPQKIKCELRQKTSDKPPHFVENRVIVPTGMTYNPMHFIYANHVFGALVCDRNGGFCWYKNSRMLALTGYDTVPEGTAEKLYFTADDKTYELFSYSTECCFYPSYAEWRGDINGAEYTVTVAVDSQLPYKIITVKTDANGQLTLNEFPVIGGEYKNGSLRFASSSGTAYVTNSYDQHGVSFFVYCKDGVSDFDGKTLSVKRLHDGESAFISGAVSSHTALKFMIKNAHKTAARYAENINGFLSPFTLNSGDFALDIFFNLYSRYQAYVCRQLARCGPAQNGGAFGFRDQLQDCLCTVYGDSLTAKATILRCASHQYLEGDVMHWFHPVTETGIRSRCSDDMLWLPFTVYKYVIVTGDTEILDIKTRYIVSEPLHENERDRYEKTVKTDVKETVLEHCIRAVSRIKTGGHGLCLMGGGDWNDGMNEAGIKGRGESVWLTLFAALTLSKLPYLCGLKGVDGSKFDILSKELKQAVEAHGFDGEHYIRGFLDDGEAIGKTGDKACEIDILPQAFASFCGLDETRVSSSLEAVYNKLFDGKNGVVKLFAPPFDMRGGIGYLTSYPGGVRENGGQYTHGAVWAAASFFNAGQPHRGYELLKAMNPVNRCINKEDFIKYGREPYALCGDIYTADGLYGRGGWPWYTGSAAWYFTTVLEYLLGYREHDGGFEIDPSFCSDFTRFTLTVKRHNTEYVITAENVRKQTTLDGIPTKKTYFEFDGIKHTLDIGAKR